MLTMVTAQNLESGILPLPITDASNGYAVRDIQGMDPVKATLTSSTIAQMDGAHHQNSRRDPRNITMKIGLEPDYVTTTVASLRSNLYNYFMPKSSVIFGAYNDDNLWGVTTAIVESCGNNMFSADPEVIVSLICYDPDFYAPEPSYIQAMTVSDTSTMTIDYNGTSETGIIFSTVFPEAAAGVRLYNTRPDMVVNVLDINGTFAANDKLTVCTVDGSKSIKVVKKGLETSVLSYKPVESTWISLKKGANLFRAYYPGNPIQYSIEYTEKYGGF